MVMCNGTEEMQKYVGHLVQRVFLKIVVCRRSVVPSFEDAENMIFKIAILFLDLCASKKLDRSF